MKYVFVILHYRTFQDTIECIESIKKLNGNYEIVVVDNYSNNGSIEIVEEKYENDCFVHIVKNGSNLGFSAGNNVGYKYAKETLNADFILVSNNDIWVTNELFIQKLESFYYSHTFDVCGPDIESLVDGGHQNPKINMITTKAIARKAQVRFLLLFFLSKMNVYDFLKMKKNQKLDKNIEKSVLKNEQFLDNVMLHGSFIIFSPNYVKKEQYAFQPGPFLYYEEQILYYYCVRKNYLMTYYPMIKVFHKEDSSTNSLYSSNKKKREFLFITLVKSLSYLIKYL